MIDVTWQLQAIASVVLSIPLGIALRRAIMWLDEQRARRHHGQTR